jgi:hypothetical protein
MKMKCKNRQLIELMSLMIISLFCGTCGKKQDSPNEVKLPRPVFDKKLESPVLKGRWVVEINGGSKDDFAAFHISSDGESLTSNYTKKVTSIITSSVTFTIDDTSFIVPQNPNQEITSFGLFKITKLSDNDLKVCGTTQKEICKIGMIRIYTSGTPNSGYWHMNDAYGVPIYTNGQIIGLNVGAAVVLSQVPITSQKVLHLSDFTQDSNLTIPISIDLTNAGTGQYQTFFVIEYLLSL